MKKYFVLYEEALALKNIGFDEPCFAGYNSKDRRNKQFTYPSAQDSNTTSKPRVYKEYASRGMKGIIKAPLYEQVFRWFREKHKLHCEIVVQLGFEHWSAHVLPSGEWFCKNVDTYEKAELACLKKLIELVK